MDRWLHVTAKPICLIRNVIEKCAAVLIYTLLFWLCAIGPHPAYDRARIFRIMFEPRECVCDSATMFADVCICSWRAWKYDIYRKKVIYLYFASIYYIWLSVIYSYLFMRFMFLERGLRKEPAGEILGHGRSRSGKRGQPPSRQSCRFHCGLGLGVQPFLFQRD